MFLVSPTKKYKAQRFVKTLYRYKSWDKRFMFFLKNFGQKHNMYHHTFFKKQPHFGFFSFCAIMPKWYFFCVNFVQTRTRAAGIFKSPNGSYIVTPLVDAVRLGDKIAFLKNCYKLFFYLSIGALTKLKFLKIATLVSNIGYAKPVYSTSLGTFSKIRLVKRSYILVCLPSGVFKSFTPNSFGIIGRNSGAKAFKEVMGKFSNASNKRLRIIVRSCAKNPVDHPNGGRTRGKMTTKTP